MRIEKSFSSCQTACLNDHQCNAFSYEEGNSSRCIISNQPLDFIDSFVRLFAFESSFRLPQRYWNISVTGDHNCAVILNRNWNKLVLNQGDDGDNRTTIVYQDDCDFNSRFDFENPTITKSFNDCVMHCVTLKRCTHFSYSSSNEICNVKNALLLTDRLEVGGGIICGYLPDRQPKSEDSLAGLVVDDEFIRRLKNGYRMEKPEFMPEDIGRLMTDCWKPEPHQRPTFSQLRESLGVYMETTVGCANYLQMNNVFIEKDVPVNSISDDADNSDVPQNQEIKREEAIDAFRSSFDYVVPLASSGSSATGRRDKKSFTFKLKKLPVMSARNSIRSTDQTKTTTT